MASFMQTKIISCEFNTLTSKEMQEILIENLNLEYQLDMLYDAKN